MAGYGRERGPEFQRRALETISLLPGATGAALANTIPLNLDQSSTTVYPEQTTEFRPRNSITAVYYYVSPGYFDVIGTRLLYGRQFTPQDAAGSAPVAIVNEDFARRVLGEGDWVGKRFTFGSGQPPIEVVGVVENGKYMTLTEGQRPAIFQPILQRYSPVALLMVRSSLPPAQMALEMRKAVAALDPHLPLYGGGDLTQMLRLLFLPANAAVISLGAFGVLATMLALTSIHGLASYSVAKRTREIGIRVAIGARPGDVVRLVFGRTGFLVAIGAIVGMAAGVLGSKLLAGIVLGVSARDPLVFALTALTMMITGVAAAWKPLRRAVRVPPVIALKSE
jgi:ABC-type antimicrobial peptide transport system permease subunit